MKIIVVDDNYEKIPHIQKLCKGLEVAADIDHFTTGSAARRALARSSYDLLIVDLNFADETGAAASERGGINFLKLISLNPGQDLSSNVIVLTAREDLHDRLANEAVDLGAQVCYFSEHQTAWVAVLSGRIRLISNIVKKRAIVMDAVDVVIITALRSPELEAVLKLPYKFKLTRLPKDPTTYHFGEFEINGIRKTVAAVASTRKGMSAAAALAAKVVSKFKPKMLVMTGICAGVVDKVNLGDVIVCDPGWDWGAGKYAETEGGFPTFKPAPHQTGLDSSLREVARDLAEDAEIKKSIRAGWDKPVPAGVFSIHVGPMASGGAVIADERLTKQIVAQHKDLIGVDMEAYAVMAAAESAVLALPLPVVIKSVCDYADAEKNDDWQKYASYTSAAFAKFFIDKSMQVLAADE